MVEKEVETTCSVISIRTRKKDKNKIGGKIIFNTALPRGIYKNKQSNYLKKRSENLCRRVTYVASALEYSINE